MDEQRLERALRQGPPFATRYVPSSLALDKQTAVRGPGVSRLVLIVAVTALLLVGTLAGLAALGAFRPEPSPPWEGLPEGPHLLVDRSEGRVPITVTIATPLWHGEPNGGSLCWRDPTDTCAGPPDGAGMIAFESRRYHVYGDACHRDPGPRPDITATTVDELVDAMARQVHRSASVKSPVDITVDGYAGKKIVLYSEDMSARFDCDDDTFALFGLPGDEYARNGQGFGEIEELWVVNVDGLIVVLDGRYYADTPQNVVDELGAILASATFDMP